jgi:hypothetical protein
LCAVAPEMARRDAVAFFVGKRFLGGGAAIH